MEIFTRNLESSSASALGSTVSMTGYRNAYKLDIPMQWPMAIANGDGDGDDDDEQRAEATIDGEESRRDSYCPC